MNMFNRGDAQRSTSKDDSGGLKDLKQKIRTPVNPQQTGDSGADSRQSVISKDLIIVGNLETKGDVAIEGKVQGDIKAKVLTVGVTAEIKGQLKAQEMIVNGRIIGGVRGNKGRLNKSARVDGDVIHETLSIEAGAYFEGSVRRTENPLEGGRGGKATDTARSADAQPSQQQSATNKVAPQRI